MTHTFVILSEAKDLISNWAHQIAQGNHHRLLPCRHDVTRANT